MLMSTNMYLYTCSNRGSKTNINDKSTRSGSNSYVLETVCKQMDSDGNIALLRTKCPCTARALGVECSGCRHLYRPITLVELISRMEPMKHQRFLF